MDFFIAANKISAGSTVVLFILLMVTLVTTLFWQTDEGRTVRDITLFAAIVAFVSMTIWDIVGVILFLILMN